MTSMVSQRCLRPHPAGRYSSRVPTPYETRRSGPRVSAAKPQPGGPPAAAITAGPNLHRMLTRGRPSAAYRAPRRGRAMGHPGLSTVRTPGASGSWCRAVAARPARPRSTAAPRGAEIGLDALPALRAAQAAGVQSRREAGQCPVADGRERRPHRLRYRRPAGIDQPDGPGNALGPAGAGPAVADEVAGPPARPAQPTDTTPVPSAGQQLGPPVRPPADGPSARTCRCRRTDRHRTDRRRPWTRSTGLPVCRTVARAGGSPPSSRSPRPWCRRGSPLGPVTTAVPLQVLDDSSPSPQVERFAISLPTVQGGSLRMSGAVRRRA